MILILLLLIVAAIVSVLLAYLSLHDYQDTLQDETGVYLIRKIKALNKDFLESLNSKLRNEEEIVSLEKLIKGKRVAMVIYGPKHLIESFKELDLLELEDYSRVVPDKNIFCWEVVPRMGKRKLDLVFPEVQVADNEQVFYQVVLQKDNSSFQSTARVVVVAEDITRKLKLMNDLGKLIEGKGFSRKKLKKTSATLYKAYKLRSITPKLIYKFNLKYEELLKLLS